MRSGQTDIVGLGPKSFTIARFGLSAESARATTQLHWTTKQSFILSMVLNLIYSLYEMLCESCLFYTEIYTKLK